MKTEPNILLNWSPQPQSKPQNKGFRGLHKSQLSRFTA